MLRILVYYYVLRISWQISNTFEKPNQYVPILIIFLPRPLSYVHSTNVPLLFTVPVQAVRYGSGDVRLLHESVRAADADEQPGSGPHRRCLRVPLGAHLQQPVCSGRPSDHVHGRRGAHVVTLQSCVPTHGYPARWDLTSCLKHLVIVVRVVYQKSMIVTCNPFVHNTHSDTDSNSDTFYSTEIDTSTISNLEEFHKKRYE